MILIFILKSWIESSSAVQCHMLSVFLLEENMNFLKRFFLCCVLMLVCSFYHDISCIKNITPYLKVPQYLSTCIMSNTVRLPLTAPVSKIKILWHKCDTFFYTWWLFNQVLATPNIYFAFSGWTHWYVYCITSLCHTGVDTLLPNVVRFAKTGSCSKRMSTTWLTGGSALWFWVQDDIALPML